MNIFKIFKKKESEEPDWYKQLKNDYGKEDAFGPWSKMDEGDPIKIYKSYYFIHTKRTKESTNIENIN